MTCLYHLLARSETNFDLHISSFFHCMYQQIRIYIYQVHLFDKNVEIISPIKVPKITYIGLCLKHVKMAKLYWQDRQPNRHGQHGVFIQKSKFADFKSPLLLELLFQLYIFLLEWITTLQVIFKILSRQYSRSMLLQLI